MDISKRRKISIQRFSSKPNFYLRIWFPKTNTYSETLHVNHAIFYKYTDEEKNDFKAGHSVFLKDNGKEVKGLILATGSFEKMNFLENQLEEMADNHSATDDVLNKIHKTINEGSDYSSQDDDDDEPKRELEPVSKIRKTISQEKQKVLQLKKSFPAGNNDSAVTKRPHPNEENRSQTGTVLNKKDFVSNLMLAEMRVQTTLLKLIHEDMRELNKSLLHLREPDENIPRENATLNGLEGTFTLESLSAANPNIFARRLLKLRHTVEDLSNSILCPKGKTSRKPFKNEEVVVLQDALKKWFGSEFSWKAVVLSVNQFLRELKAKK